MSASSGILVRLEETQGKVMVEMEVLSLMLGVLGLAKKSEGKDVTLGIDVVNIFAGLPRIFTFSGINVIVALSCRCWASFALVFFFGTGRSSTMATGMLISFNRCVSVTKDDNSLW